MKDLFYKTIWGSAFLFCFISSLWGIEVVEESEICSYEKPIIEICEPKEIKEQQVVEENDKFDFSHIGSKDAKDYIDRFKKIAVTEMHKYGIPASIKMAQGLHESNNGKSKLAKNANNHFGVKCVSTKCEEGHCIRYTDDSHKDFFRKYKTSWHSWRAHSKFLQKKRYKGLQGFGKDYKKWAYGLKKAGYATDPNYPQKIIKIIEQNNLQKLDN